MTRAWPLLAAGVLLTGVLGGCGSEGAAEGSGESKAESGGERAAESALTEAADRTVCHADAQPAAGAISHLPSGWTFPPATTAYDVEDRDGVGTIVTAISTTPFDRVLDHLNDAETGVRVTGGETEEDDAEASWTAAGYTGRWAIRKSATCAGETLIQVLATPTD